MNEAKLFNLALVTGASSGIGRELARILADNNINLIITARNEKMLKELALELKEKVNVEIFPADLSNRIERRYLIDLIYQRKPDLVVNNAGFGLYGPTIKHETEKMMNMLEVNSAALMEISIETCKALIAANKKGVILNVSSIAAFQVFPLFAVYAATKSFVNSFSEALDYEVKSKGVRVLTTCPGMVKTNFTKNAGKEVKNTPITMSVEFAAKEIWWQIKKRKPLHLFDWKFRLSTFLSKYVLPKKFLIWALIKGMKKRMGIVN